MIVNSLLIGVLSFAANRIHPFVHDLVFASSKKEMTYGMELLRLCVLLSR